VPEIMAYGGLTRRPIFVPSVGNFAQGMLVSIPLFLDDLPEKPEAEELEAALAAHYAETAAIRVLRPDGETRLEPESLNDTNGLELRVFANPAQRQAVLVAKFDNLGKGASGAAVQNLRLMLGLDE
jgi:N-acetyl-gamma-glutamyl-phosphate reductase